MFMSTLKQIVSGSSIKRDNEILLRQPEYRIVLRQSAVAQFTFQTEILIVLQ